MIGKRELKRLSYRPRGCIDFPPVIVHLIETQLCKSKVKERVSVLDRVLSSINWGRLSDTRCRLGGEHTVLWFQASCLMGGTLQTWPTWIAPRTMNLSELTTDPMLSANSSHGDFFPGRASNHSCPLGWGLNEGLETCVLETAVIVLLTVLIIAGNLTVIFVFHCAPLLHHYTTSYFIQTMAYADLLVGLSCLVPTLSLLHYPAGVQEPITCQVFSYVISVLKSVSMACLACISVDRYLAITKPLSYNQLVTPCRLRGCITLIWVYSSLVFLPSFFGWGKPGYHGDIFEWCAHSWPTSALFTGFVVCLLYAPAALVVCFTYYHIFRICQQHNREISERRARFPSQEMEAGDGGGGGHHGGHGPDRRYAMVLFRITSVFYMLWLPYIIYFLLESSHVLDSPALSFITTWLAISNSFCNCVIYSLSNSVFRLGMRRLSQTMCSFSHCAADDKDFGEPKPRKRANSCSIWKDDFYRMRILLESTNGKHKS